MAVVEIIYDVKDYSYITSNPTKILSNGEPIYLNDGRFGFGDGVTTLSALPLFGSATTWGSITGTLSNQTDLQRPLIQFGACDESFGCKLGGRPVTKK